MTQKKEFVTMTEIAARLNLDRSHARKYVLKHGFTFMKVRTPESRNQLTLALSPQDADTIVEIREKNGYPTERSGFKSIQPIVNESQGYFYIIQLIPELAPKRVKLGFATDVDARLSAHKNTAPTATVIKTYPCMKVWEAAAISSITRVECKNIGGEVFECVNLKRMIQRAEEFFRIMPKP